MTDDSRRALWRPCYNIIMRRFTRIFVPTFIAMFVCALARADDWSITTADFQTHQAAALRGLGADGVRFVAAGTDAQEQTIPLDQFVSLQRAASDAAPTATTKFTLFLAGGDRLTGEPVRVANEQVTWHSPALGEITLPLQRLVSLVRGGDGEPAAPAEPASQDVARLANGDSVAGVATDITADHVTIKTDAGAADVPLGSVTQLTFATVASHASTNAAGAFQVKLIDGSAVTVADASIDQQSLKIALGPKSSAQHQIDVPLAQISAIEQLNGPVTWLSSLTPIERVQTPYFGGSPPWPARNDAAVDGGPLHAAGQSFTRGIGVHSYSRLTYDIAAGNWPAFRTQYAIDTGTGDAPRQLADVTVRIKLDDRVVHEQAHIRAGELSPVFNVDLSGAKRLTLEVDYGDAGDTQDHFDWIEPALLRHAAVVAPPPSTEPAPNGMK